MDTATKQRLEAFRQNVLAPTSRKSAITAATPAKPEIPRFKNGRAKDLRTDLEEILDFELVELAGQGDTRATAYVRTVEAELNLWLENFGATAAREQRDRLEAEATKSAAAALGTTPERLLDPANASEMAQRHENNLLDAQIEDLELRRRPIPEPETANT